MWHEAGAICWPDGMVPAAQRARTVLLFGEVFGIGDHMEDVARRLYGCGFNVCAANLRRGEPRLMLDYAEGAAAMNWAVSQTEAGVKSMIEEAIAEIRGLKLDGPLSTLGFRFGGRVAALAAAWFPDAIESAACVYGNGLLGEPKLPHLSASFMARSPLLARMLFIFAQNDPDVSDLQRNEVASALRAHDVHFDIYTFDAADKFLNARHENYRDEPARQAWQILECFVEKRNLPDFAGIEHIRSGRDA